MAKIDDSVKKKVPELRFPGFTDDWEERKLGEFSDVRDGTHASPKYVSQGHPMVTSKNLTHSGLDMTDVSFLTDEDFNEINKRSKVSIGDILFGMIGTIGNPVIVDRDDFAIKNVALIKEKTSNPITNKWLLPYLKSPSFNRFIQKENAGGTQKFIALGLIRDMKLRVPEFDEQQKIGSFFKQLDNTITLHQRKLDLLKEQKKGYLQKMFPKNGAKVPELRFAGFADDWEERKLGDLGSVAMNRRIFKDQTSENEEVPFFKIGTFGSKPDAFISRELFEEYKLKYPYPEIGDILISASGSIGRTVVYQGEDEYFQDSNIVWLKHDNRLDNKFLKQFYSIVKWQGLEGSTIKRLYNKNILDTDISIPSTIEQNKIGMFFEQLDDTIALHQRKLDLLKEQKKGYLQKMFV
ncbi:restriction endonuclease subunit S [Lactococcus lactis]|nr:restriction endonuclease subunit S [Lactococcus lactis]MDM7652556.1 restriction endonuclease subunit S [Lactococcus lactis]